jgi:hypothetical protein
MSRIINPTTYKQKAVCVVFSWMRSWKIDVRLPTSPDEGDIVVGDKRIVLCEGATPPEYDLSLSPSAILGTDLKATLVELHRLTEFLGRGSPEGFRKNTNIKRASPNDYLGVSLRLTPFARTPNIPEADVLKWMPVLKREADRAGRRCRGILYNMGLDRNDLMSIGLVYLVTYLNRHQTLGNDQVNGGNLTRSLMQRYGRWASVTIRHLKKVAPITSGIPIDAIMGSPCPNSIMWDSHGTDREASYTFNPEIMDGKVDNEPTFFSIEQEQNWLRRKAMKDGKYLAKRRRNAKAALDLALEEMPHDRMVFTLSEVIASDFQHPDARIEAHKRLDLHQNNCDTCRITSTDQTEDTKTSGPTLSV